MKGVILNLAVAVLTFSVSAGASIIRRLGVHDTPDIRRPWVSGQPEVLLAMQPVTEVPLVVIGGMDACGPQANFHTNNLSDGTQISNSCRTMASPAAAARALRKGLASATEIIERSPNLDEHGKRIGERVIAQGVGIMELETSGRIFCSTEAASLKHLDWYYRR
jgi:hypothetical protein